MKVFLHEHRGGSNHIMDYEGLRVAFDDTEWLEGDLYLHLDRRCVCCLDERSYTLVLFESNDYVIDNNLAH